MRHHLVRALFAFALAGGGGNLPAVSAPATSTQAPEFTHEAATEWLNTSPLTLAGLGGHVVLIEFWTFDCYNCRNTLPWLKAIHAEYGPRGLKVISVHTPELPQERRPENVRAAVQELGIEYPVMLDEDFSYWRALGNRYWPAFYVVGRDGKIVLSAFGELHRGTPRGDQVEARIRELIGQH